MGIFSGIIFWVSVVVSALLGHKAAHHLLHWQELMVLLTCVLTVSYGMTWILLEALS